MQKEKIIAYLRENKNLLKSGTDNYINLVEAFFEKCEERGMDCPLLDVPEENMIEHLEDLYFMNLTARIIGRKAIQRFCQVGQRAFEYDYYPHLEHLLELVYIDGLDEEEQRDFTQVKIGRNEYEARHFSRDTIMLQYHLLDLM